MARINIAGAESGSSTGDPGATLTTNASVQSTVKRTGAYAFRVNATGANTGYVELVSASNVGFNGEFNLATAYYRFYFRYATKPAANDEAIFWATNSGGGSNKMQVRLHSDGKLRAYKFFGGAGVIGTGTTTLSADTWYRIEVQVGTGNPASWEVKINGTTEMSGSHDMQTANQGRCRLGKDPSNTNSQDVDFFYDDIAIDDAGFPGPGEVKVLKPDGNGTYIAWTGDWNDVKQLPHDDTTTMITTSTNTNAESVTMENTGAAGISGTVKAVVALAVAREIGGGSVNAAIRLRSGTTDSDGADVTLPSSFGGLGHLRETDPATSAAWTLSGVDGIQVGIVHKQSQSRQADCTALYAMVEYEPAAGGDTTLTASKGVLSLAGKTNSFREALAAAKNSLALSGKAAVYTWTTGAAKGSLALAGGTSTFTEALLADKNSLSLTGKDATFRELVILAAAKGLLSLSGGAVVFQQALLADKNALTLTGKDVAPTIALEAAKAALALAGGTATFQHAIDAIKAELTLAGADAAFVQAFVLAAAKGALTLAGANTSFAETLLAAKGLLSFAGKDAVPTDVLPAAKGTLVLSGDDALFTQILNAEKVALVLVGKTATFGGDITLNAEKGLLALTGNDAAFVHALGAIKGTLVLSGDDAAFLTALLAEKGVLVLAGSDADLVGGGGGGPEAFRKLISLTSLHRIIHPQG